MEPPILHSQLRERGERGKERDVRVLGIIAEGQGQWPVAAGDIFRHTNVNQSSKQKRGLLDIWLVDCIVI